MSGTSPYTRRNDGSGGGTAAAGTAAAGAEDMLIGADLTPTDEHAAGLEETQTFTIECMHNYRRNKESMMTSCPKSSRAPPPRHCSSLSIDQYSYLPQQCGTRLSGGTSNAIDPAIFTFCVCRR